ncbi:MAG TPA: hypothetical protein VFF03_00370 [Rhodocyclaceae bacterium]|nr:hypothetical protein [Rhodocyclaceae bacterium]
MSQSKKSSRIAGLLLGLAASAVQAGIILDNGVVVQGSPMPPDRRVMNSIILAPGGAQPETSYLLQRSMAWQTYRRRDANTGALLVYPPALGGVGAPTSIRQLEVRNHLSRANAYRLNYFRK